MKTRFNGLVVVLGLLLQSVTMAGDAAPSAGQVSRHTLKIAGSDQETSYLVYEPAAPTPKEKRALLIYLYGAGGSVENYNLRRDSYATLRSELAKRGYYILVPELGPRHFMNDAAKKTLDALVDRVLADYEIDPTRVHIMGTSMGAGSALAYAIHRPKAIRSICAVMPMTDFAAWAEQNPKYAQILEQAYEGTAKEKQQAYDGNSAMKNLDAFANIPVLIIHGMADKTVLYENSVRLAEAMKAKGYRCVLRPVDGAAHTDAVMADHQVEAADFFDEAMK